MRQLEELRLLAKVAHLYHEQGLSQSEIARRLYLSQATISRLLKRAIEEQIVRITVSLPPGVHADIETELCACFGLKEAIVVDSTSANDEDIQRDVGTAAAFYITNTLKKGEIVGLSSWSATLLAMVDAMHALPQALNAQVVQILGGVGHPDAEVHATRLTDRFSRLVHGTANYLTVPGVVGSTEARAVLLQDPFVDHCVGLFDNVTLALVGIGSIEPSKLLARSGNIFSENELSTLREQGAVGDICLRFFDADGLPVVTPLDERVISMRLQQLRNTERAVGIAGGVRKVAAVRGALKGQWINVLITDRNTAQRLLAESEPESA